ncbi:MAG: YbaN family protein [Clostridia bacterium]|nr:YbaN family protein [Clostridia bacterium]
MKLKKLFWIILGFIGLGLGALGAILPMIPSIPFLLLAAFGFGKSSEKLHTWFVNTKLYKNNLESYVKGEGMTKKTKVKIILTVTLLMTFGFVMMLRKALFIPCTIIAIIWTAHLVYFLFFVKTRKTTNSIQA